MSTAVTYADVRVTLDHPIEAVWAVVAAFGRIDRWVAGVTGCQADGEGPGTIRTVFLTGRQVREQLEAIDLVDRKLSYRILSPHGLPAQNVSSEIHLIPVAGGVEMRWRSEATDLKVPAEVLGARIEDFYRRSIEGLDRMLRDDEVRGRGS